MGRAGRGPSFEQLMGWAGPRPILSKFDGPGRAAAHSIKFCWAGPGRGPWDVGSIWAAPPGPWGGPCVL